MTTTISIQASPEQLADLINERVKNQLDALEKRLRDQQAQDDLLTREEACNLLQINLSTLWDWTRKGRLTAYGISGNRRYYKRSELMEALTPIKQK